MDYSIKKEPVFSHETVFDGVTEQPVDLDFSLPDYCPDIHKILKCAISPQIESRNISGDKVYIEGTANVVVVYIDEEKMALRSHQHTLPFSASVDMKNAAGDAIVQTKVKTEYVNCRAVTPRRLDIHGAFSISVRVTCRKVTEIVCDIAGPGIEKKKSMQKCSNVLGLGQQSFTVEETIDKSGSPGGNIEYILKTVVSAELQDYKTLTNKVMINAQINIKILYVSDIEYGTIDELDYSIPFSQVVDIEGVQDDCICNVAVEVLNYNIDVRQGADDESSLLAFEGRVTVSAVAYDDKTTTVLGDVYSIDYESEPEYGKISLTHLCGEIDEPYVSRNNIKVGDGGITELIDINGEILSVKSFIKDGQVHLTGKINVCILARDDMESPFYVERILEFEHCNDLAHQEACSTIFCEEHVTLKSCDGKINGKNSIEVTAELHMGGLLYAKNECTCVTGIYVDEENPRKKDKKTALTIYYADDGEELWDIAQKYCTSVERIKAENDLDDEVLHGRSMVFIPM